MKLKSSLIAAMIAIATLSGCGGSDDETPAIPVASPAVLTSTDTTVGTGAEATTGKRVTLNYTGYLYSDTAADNKGLMFESSVGKTPLTFTLGLDPVIPGFLQGVTGMKVGGKRTVKIPASLAYGASGKGTIPPNAGLVFDLELISVQ